MGAMSLDNFLRLFELYAGFLWFLRTSDLNWILVGGLCEFSYRHAFLSS